MPNIKLTLQYDGTRYLGWTRPAADGYAKTISYRISSVLQKMTGEDITLFAGAKTAPGVHALCQTVNFHTESPFSDTYFLSKLNEYLPKDIHILSSEIVSDRFRSDLNAVSNSKETENDSFSLLTIKICANDFLYLMPEHIIEFLIKKGVDKEVRCNPAGLLLHSITYPDSCSVPSAGSKQV